MVDSLIDMFALTESETIKILETEDYNFDRAVDRITKNRQKEKEKEEKKKEKEEK